MWQCRRPNLPCDQDQFLLLPPSIREWVEPGDLAHLIDDVVECLDLGAIEAVYEAEWGGTPPYHISREIEAWFKEADRVDAAEDRVYGDEQGEELPPELQNAARRRLAIKEAMAELEQEAKEKGKGEPLAKAQPNFTDPESRIMRSGEGAFI